jgi:hypothetical protein
VRQPFSNPYQTTGDIYYPLRVVMFIGLLSIVYSLSKPGTMSGEEVHALLPDTRSIEPTELLPWQKRASEKAIQRYTDAQKKMWNNWNDAMFERKD